MKSGEKKDGENSDRAFFNSKRDWPCDLMGGGKRESRRSHAGVGHGTGCFTQWGRRSGSRA